MMAAAAAAHARAKLISATQNLHHSSTVTSLVTSPTTTSPILPSNGTSRILVNALHEQHKSFLEKRGEVAPQADSSFQISPRSDVSSCSSTSPAISAAATSPTINNFQLNSSLCNNNNNNILDKKAYDLYMEHQIRKGQVASSQDVKVNFEEAGGSFRYSPNLQRSI